MPYRWSDFRLDRNGTLLTQAGRQIDVTRKVLDCIGHLIEHHDRVVGFDELILAIWGHADVTNHQLSQVVLAARRAIGDDGQAQRCIRTVSGIGYRWVATLEPDAPPDAPPDAMEAASTPAPPRGAPDIGPAAADVRDIPDGPRRDDPKTAHPQPSTRRSLRTAATLSLCLLVPGMPSRPTSGSSAYAGDAPNTMIGTRGDPSADPIGSLRQALQLGRYETVREGLIDLPEDIADGMEARLIEIELDIRRGRYARATEKLATRMARVDASNDPIGRARLLLLQSELNNRRRLSGAEVLAPAEAALALLEYTGLRVPPDVIADALWHRAGGYVASDRFEDAQRDLIRARDLYQRIGDAHRDTIVRGSLARVRMRNGDLVDALEEMRAVADQFAKHDDRIREIFSRNTMTKIQVELLRWDDALASSDRSMRLLRDAPESERRYPTLQLRALVLTGLGRLREAASLLEEADGLSSERRDGIIPAIHHLEAGDAQAALDAATWEFENTGIDTRSNLLFENKDGALLLWVVAAQAKAASGDVAPTPSEAQIRQLQDPQTAVARTARGRWLMLQGRASESEAELKLALAEFSAKNQLYRMIFAAEPLIDSMLQRGDVASAKDLLVSLRARDPGRVDDDYRISLLSLKIALAEGDPTAVSTTYRRVLVASRERRPPDILLTSYRKFAADGRLN